MGSMLRSRKNHKHHTDCEYGCCKSPVTKGMYRARDKRKIDRLLRSAY